MKGWLKDFSGSVCVLILLTIGLINLWSASNTAGSSLFAKQILWVLIGSGLGLWCYLTDYKQFEDVAYYLYFGGVFLLSLLYPFGVEIEGAKRWLGFGGFYIQPSEFAKLGLILALARYFSKRPFQGDLSLSDLGLPIVMVLLPFFLVIFQPDLGTGLVLVGILGILTLWIGVRKRTLLFLGVLGGFGCVGGWFLLKDYQRQRILSFLDPWKDPLGSGYHLIQSKIAIGSGSIWGKGIQLGTQARLGFLPEYHTDFVFALLGEEWGFVGAAVVILLFLGFLLWAFETAQKAKDPFGRFLAMGITSLFLLHVTINIGMALGLLPVVGLPLPFFSYGGSCTVVSLMAVGLLSSIRKRRRFFGA